MGVQMSDGPFIAELARIEKKSGTKLDDNSIGFLAQVRGNDLLQDDEWERIKGFLRDALGFLARSDKPESDGRDLPRRRSTQR